ncbi:MAG: peptidylprolyl isomerase [Gemmatimonadaceae bacterium]|nr:peptidylprolyl isomerase [Chitinophagaceae bacterium]
MKQLCFLVIAALCFASSAQSQRVIADKIVAIVGDKVILRSDVFNEILDRQRKNEPVPDNAECLVMEQALAMKALIVQAEKDSLQVSDDELEAMLDNRVRQFIQVYGSKDALEQIAGRTVYQIKEDFRNPIKDSKLAELMRNKIVEGVKITPTEVKAYFDKIPKDSLAFYESEVEIGQIVLYPKASRDLEKNALDELADYKRQVEAGERKFETLASLYTDDPGSKNTGGIYQLNRTEKTWDPTFLQAAFRLKEGQISPVIKSKFGYHIIQMVSRAGDDATVRHILKIPPITDDEIKISVSRLDSIRAKLLAGTMPFGEAVLRYSEDESSKYTAGMVQCANGTYCTIDQLDKDLVTLLPSLKAGEYSQPVSFTDERGKKGVRVAFLKSKTEPHRENLRDDYNRISLRALEEKKGDALEKWFDAKIPSYYIMIDDSFSGCNTLSKWKNSTTAGTR